MTNDVISYLEMCQREGISLQKGMNYRIGGNHSVILMSLRPNAPYHDRFEEDSTVLIYEGHDEPRSQTCPNPKAVDQPARTAKGTRTENGKFFNAAQSTVKGESVAERVRVYEKIRDGIWSYNGIFHLVDAWVQSDGHRNVFKFKLIAVEGDEDLSLPTQLNPDRRRVIPTWVKLAVWKRDGGKCTQCGASDELHFDHILPFAKGGTSITPENVQLLCARHNLEKSDKIV